MLVGIQTGATTPEYHMEIPQKVQNKTMVRSSNCTTGIYSKNKKKIVIQMDTYTPMFIAALSTIAKLWKEPKCLSTDEWIRRDGIYIHTHTHIPFISWYTHSAIKRNEILPIAMMWMVLESIMLSEISRSKKDRYHMISLICGIS